MGTDIHDMTNTPVDVSVGGKKLKARRLTIEEVFATLEATIISRKIAQARQVAADLEGDEKVKFLRDMTINLPSGQTLQGMVTEELGTLNGVRKVLFLACKDFNEDLKEEDIEVLAATDTLEELASLAEYLCGVSKFVKEINEEDRSKKAAAPTAGPSDPSTGS